MSIEIEIARCLERGRTAKAVLQTEPAALLGMAVAYHNDDSHADSQLGVAGADGKFVWTWVISLEVNLGRAKIIAAGGSADGKRGGDAMKTFTVADPGKCP